MRHLSNDLCLLLFLPAFAFTFLTILLTFPASHLKRREGASSRQSISPWNKTDLVRSGPQNKKTHFLGIFPKCRTPPSPLLGTPVSKKSMVYFAF